jgi:hypothetical protein
MGIAAFFFYDEFRTAAAASGNSLRAAMFQ